MATSFVDFALRPSLFDALATQGIAVPTEIQSLAIPELLADRSIVAVAETGSGKTLSYVLPILHVLKAAEEGGSSVAEGRKPRAVVVVPNRDLGEQVAKVFKGLTHTTRLRVRPVLGGAGLAVARRNIAAPFEVLVATPGRLVQLLDAGEILLDDVRFLVFDEADQMLDPTFLPQSVRVVQASAPNHQLALFSATLPAALDTLVGQLFRSAPVQLRTRGAQRMVRTLTTENRKVIDGKRFDVLKALLAEGDGGSTLVFVNTREQCDKLAGQLEAAGIPFAAYRGELEPAARRANLASFREGTVRLLLATDLGARGLDVENVDRVVNYHLPSQPQSYLHRAGRTARAGRTGLVVNLVTERDEALLEKLQKLEPPKRSPPQRRGR
ncbi:MAG: DEAD/DEAH box helicase [Myxococcota bacterium]